MWKGKLKQRCISSYSEQLVRQKDLPVTVCKIDQQPFASQLTSLFALEQQITLRLYSLSEVNLCLTRGNCSLSSGTMPGCRSKGQAIKPASAVCCTEKKILCYSMLRPQLERYGTLSLEWALCCQIFRFFSRLSLRYAQRFRSILYNPRSILWNFLM